MKFTIDKASILKPLSHVQSIVERRNTVPILANVQLSVEGESLHITATDMDMEVREKVTAKIETAGAVTVAAHMLYEIIRKLPDGAEVDFSLSSDRLSVKAGRSNFSLATLPAEDFPLLHAEDLSHSFKLSASALGKMIDKTRFAMSTEETRYYLNGIYLHSSEIDGRKVLRAVATDGHRLARFDADIPSGASDIPGVILPRKMVGELRKMIDGESSDVDISLSETVIRFAFGDVVLTSKLIDGTFPDYVRVIPTGNDKTLQLNCDLFSSAVDRVAIISTDKTRSVKLNINEGKLSISASSPEMGSAEEDLEISYNQGEISIGFNARYLLDIMQQIESDEVQFDFADSAAPAVLKDSGEKDALYVLMPMRV